MAKPDIKKIPKPKGSESEKEFVKRCVTELGKSNPEVKEDQRYAICYARWEELDGDNKNEGLSINKIVESVNKALDSKE